ncbi:MAG: hypothetical protein E3J72_06925 [Planctomycetota bacterium]|nr:MAG: hypothetical protein E3J72_06925 [Planctomycetota bacterium]
MCPVPKEFEEFHNQNIVLDTATPLLYIGHLVDVDDSFLTLEKVDVHDLSSTPTSKDVYLIDSRKIGVKVNRERVKVRRDLIVSITRLDDIIEY